MRLHCCYTPAHEVLYREIFLPTVPSDMVLESTLIDEAGPGDFLSPEFLRCIRRKIGLIKASLLAAEEGEILVWCDVDVRFVDLSGQELAAMLDSSSADVMFQREASWLRDVNTGFFVCRANDAVRKFFGAVGNSLEQEANINEQMAVNQLLSEGEGNSFLRWDYLPRTFYARSHGWPPPRNLSIYHANYTKGPDAVAQKMSQFAELQAILRGGYAAWAWSVARRLPRKVTKSFSGVFSMANSTSSATER